MIPHQTVADVNKQALLAVVDTDPSRDIEKRCARKEIVLNTDGL